MAIHDDAQVHVQSMDAFFRIVRVYTLQSCAPCEILKHALRLIEDDIQGSGWNLDVIQVSRDDKRSMGAALKAGISHYPTVKFVVNRQVVRSYVSIRDGWTPQDVAQFLKGEIDNYGAAMAIPLPPQR